MQNCLRLMVALGIVAMVVAPAVADHEHDDVEIGVTAAGQLAAHFGHWDEVHELAPVSGLLNGWLGEAPGFGHVEEDEPGEDLYMLAEGAEIVFEVVSFAPAFQAWADGFAYSVSEPGDQALLGDEHLHAHLDWHIDSDSEWFDPEQEVWSASFRFVDTGTTGYGSSEPYMLQFTTPEPASLGLVVVGGLLGLRRRTGRRA